MKTVKMEVPVEIARQMLAGFETQISDKIRRRDELSIEISQLEESAKTLRVELKNGSSVTGSDNRTKVREYLAKLPDNKGAKASEISKATGIGTSSTAFTLKNYTKDFVRDEETKLWKLKL